MKTNDTVKNNKEIQEYYEFDEHEYIWELIGPIVAAYSIKNRTGLLTSWGMLIDAYDKLYHGDLCDEMRGKNISLKDAARNLWAAKELHDMAIDLFIKVIRR